MLTVAATGAPGVVCVPLEYATFVSPKTDRDGEQNYMWTLTICSGRRALDFTRCCLTQTTDLGASKTAALSTMPTRGSSLVSFA